MKATSKDRFSWSLPFRPISSSDQQHWEGFSVRHYRSPAFEVTEHPMMVHRLQIQLGRPIKLEAIQEGRLLKGRFFDGDLIYTPPKVRYGARWKEEREIVVLLLEPSFVARAAQGFIAEDRIDTVPRFRFRDPLIEGIGRGLLQSLSWAAPQIVYMQRRSQMCWLSTYSNGTRPPDIRCAKLAASFPSTYFVAQSSLSTTAWTTISRSQTSEPRLI
jgi:hypothetical protein